jgi:hypothetical protein
MNMGLPGEIWQSQTCQLNFYLLLNSIHHCPNPTPNKNQRVKNRLSQTLFAVCLPVAQAEHCDVEYHDQKKRPKEKHPTQYRMFLSDGAPET